MSGPTVGELLAVPLDHVLVAEARAADVHATGMDLQPVVEARRSQMAHVGLDRHGLDTLVSQRRVAAAEPGQVVDTGDLEPHQVLGVVRDSLRVGLGEPYPDLRVEVEAVDEGRLYG
jgi:hypothetical protein